ncbi:MAG: hypothetical protein RQ971_06190 [Armatimonadota bacterium]|nr:hypothetical protein [Armatimonadota bacterium]
MNALGRLLAVGSEWGSYVALVGGAAGRGLAREVAEEASEQLGRQGARQAKLTLKSHRVRYTTTGDRLL